MRIWSLWFVVILAVTSIVVSNVVETDDRGPDTRLRAYLEVWVDNHAETSASVYLNFAPASGDASELGALLTPLSESFGCAFDPQSLDSGTWTDPVDGTDGYYFHARCHDSFRRDGLTFAGAINLIPFKQAAVELGAEAVEISLGHVETPYTEADAVLGEFDAGWGYGHYRYLGEISEAPDEVSMSFGFPMREIFEAALATVALILLPVVALLGRARRAIERFEAGGKDQWFQLHMTKVYVSITTVALWAGVVWYYQLGMALIFAIGGEPFGHVWYDLLRNSVWGVVPVITVLLSSAIVHPAATRIRGQHLTLVESLTRTAGSLGMVVLPGCLLFTALKAVFSENWRAFVLLSAAACSIFFVIAKWLRDLQGGTPQPLTHGELRDRVFQLARQAGVDLRQLFIMTTGKDRMANAFSVGKQDVMITDYLIEKLSKREVDAIIGHELSHLKGGHDVGIFTIVPVIVGTIGVVVLNFIEGVPGWAFGALMVVATMVTLGVVSRRFERAADAGAVSLTSDAEAFITGQIKVAAMNHLPLEWNGAVQAVITHPSTLKRIEAAAKHAGLTSAQVQEIIRKMDVDSTDRYSLPADADSPVNVWTADVLSSIVIRKSALMLAVASVIVVTFAWAAQQTADREWIPELLEISGVVLAWGLLALLDKWSPLTGVRRILERLRLKIEHEGYPVSQWPAVSVGFAPGSGLRLFHGSSYWDIGYVVPSEDRLSFVGESVAFSLKRDQIVGIDFVSHVPPVWPDKVTLIRWKDDRLGRSGAFQVGYLSQRALFELFRPTDPLRQALNDWEQRVAVSATPAALESLTSPALPDVTSEPVSKMASSQTILGAVMLGGVAALVLGLLAGLPFDPFAEDRSGLAVMMMGMASYALLVWPYYRRYRADDSKQR